MDPLDQADNHPLEDHHLNLMDPPDQEYHHLIPMDLPDQEGHHHLEDRQDHTKNSFSQRRFAQKLKTY